MRATHNFTAVATLLVILVLLSMVLLRGSVVLEGVVLEPDGVTERLADEGLAGEAVSRVERSIGAAVEPRTAAKPASEDLDLEIRGTVVADSDGRPLGNYSVSATPPGGLFVGDDERAGRRWAVTDSEGTFLVSGLSEAGPWALQVGPTWHRGPTTWSWLRSKEKPQASVAASTPGNAAVVVLRVKLGARIEWTAPLPKGLTAADLMAEVQPLPVDTCFDTNNSINIRLPAEPLGGICHGINPGTVGVQLEALFRPDQIGPPMIRLSSKDGLWALVTTHEEVLGDESGISIPEALEPRGKIVVRAEFPSSQPEEANTTELAHVARDIPWRIPGDAADRALLPRTNSSQARKPFFSSRRWIVRPDGLLEFDDLPIGPIEIGAVSYRYASGELAREGFAPVNLVLTRVVHGEPEPVTIRMRRVAE